MLRAAAKASTAGSASPSFIPDSRFSECRIRRGTRGLVTTLEDSTGSVGESSAPSRKDSVQLRPVTTLAVSATSTAVSGIARTSLRSGRRQCACSISPSTSSPSRKRITTSATVASSETNDERASKRSAPVTPGPNTKPISTNSEVSDTKPRRSRPETKAPSISSAPSTSSAT